MNKAKIIIVAISAIFIVVVGYFLYINFSLSSNYYTQRNINKVQKYTKELVRDNISNDMSALNEPFTWDKEFSDYKWKYYNGLMMYALYQTGFYDKYVEKYYFDNISPKGNVRVKHKFNIRINRHASLDKIMPVRTLFYMGDSKYAKKYYYAIEHFYNYLHSFDVLSLCGGNYRHKNTGVKAWSDFPFALDGLYSSAVFLTEYSVMNHSP